MIIPTPPSGNSRDTSNQTGPSPVSAAGALGEFKLKQPISAEIVRVHLLTRQLKALLPLALQRTLQSNPRAKAEAGNSTSIAPNWHSKQLQAIEVRLPSGDKSSSGKSLILITDQPLQRDGKVLLKQLEGGRLGFSPITLNKTPGNSDQSAPPSQSSQLQRAGEQSLRQNLPLARPLGQIFTNITQAAELLGKLSPLPDAPTQLKPLLNTLATLKSQLRTPAELGKPDRLAQTIRQSGPLLENQLANIIRTESVDSANARAPLALAHDIKWLLARALNLSSALQPAMDKSVQTPPEWKWSELKNLTAQALLTQINAQSPQPLSSRQLITQLIVLLHQQLLASMAQIKSKQAHSGLRQLESPPGNSGISTELAIRFGDHLHTLEIQIDEDSQSRSRQPDTAKKERRWQVSLNFDLGVAGNLFAQLKIQGEHLSAELWTEQPSLLLRAREALPQLDEKLRSQGLKVDRILCQQGQPLSAQNRLSYQLVDIHT